MSKRHEKDDVYRAFVDMYWYNLEPDFIVWLRNKVHDMYHSVNYNKFDNISFTEVDEKYDLSGDLQFVWGMLVLMFGDYGTSPRTGWLNVDEDQKLLDFLNDMVEDLSEDGD